MGKPLSCNPKNKQTYNLTDKKDQLELMLLKKENSIDISISPSILEKRKKYKTAFKKHKSKYNKELLELKETLELLKREHLDMKQEIIRLTEKRNQSRRMFEKEIDEIMSKNATLLSNCQLN